MMDTRYALSTTDARKLNAANTASAAVVNTIVSDWTTTQGAFPPAPAGS